MDYCLFPTGLQSVTGPSHDHYRPTDILLSDQSSPHRIVGPRCSRHCRLLDGGRETMQIYKETQALRGVIHIIRSHLDSDTIDILSILVSLCLLLNVIQLCVRYSSSDWNLTTH
ncbi:unnamed protein product [Dicrocoelium dendriticum]|nr:unnamed protein product [Dicrocoelium dendriticum]